MKPNDAIIPGRQNSIGKNHHRVRRTLQPVSAIHLLSAQHTPLGPPQFQAYTNLKSSLADGIHMYNWLVGIEPGTKAHFRVSYPNLDFTGSQLQNLDKGLPSSEGITHGLGANGFAPIDAISWMDVVDQFFSGYGEDPTARVPTSTVWRQRQCYVEREFPKLDYIKKATMIMTPRIAMCLLARASVFRKSPRKIGQSRASAARPGEASLDGEDYCQINLLVYDKRGMRILGPAISPCVASILL